jgi:5-methylcytosine-specific restriction endonuclease McrA
MVKQQNRDRADYKHDWYARRRDGLDPRVRSEEMIFRRYGQDALDLDREVGHKCESCGKSGTRMAGIHHLLPRSLGGTNERTNLIVLCPTCHRLAHAAIEGHALRLALAIVRGASAEKDRLERVLPKLFTRGWVLKAIR